MTPQQQAMEKAEELYARDPRWRMIIDSSTYAALESTAAVHSPFALAREAAMIMLGRIFMENGEIAALQHTLDLMQQQALQMSHLTTPSVVLPIECNLSHDGRHHVDTSMEAGSNHCFHCEQPMPNNLRKGETK